MPMPVADRQSRRAVSGVRLALLVAALVAAAIAVVWMAGPWATETPSTDPERPPPEPTAVGSVPSAAATLAGIAAIREDFIRNAALYRLVDGATREQVEAWLAELETLPSTPHRYDIARVLYIRFAVLDPEAAVDHALLGATKPVWLEAIFRTWGEFDHAAALMRASNLHPSADVFHGWFGHDAQGASAALRRYPRGPARDDALDRLVGANLSAFDPQAAERLFDAIESPDKRRGAASRLHRYYTQVDPNERRAAAFRDLATDEDP